MSCTINKTDSRNNNNSSSFEDISIINDYGLVSNFDEKEYYTPIFENFVKSEDESINSESDNLLHDLNPRSITSFKKSFEKIRKTNFKFNIRKYYENRMNEIELEYEGEIKDCKESLGEDYKCARGRGRKVQKKNLSKNQLEKEKKLHLLKNKYCAKKTRIKRNQELEKMKLQIDFLKNKNKNYELLLEKLISKI
jgi:hypothetical protein